MSLSLDSMQLKNRTSGLSENRVLFLRGQYGPNSLPRKRSNLRKVLLKMAIEPMFLLLVVASALYFILGQFAEGIMMVIAIAIVTAISIYQEVKSFRALSALRELTSPRVTVIRDGIEKIINTEELVPGDLFMLQEGDRVPADAEVVQSNDLSVNEAILTGESLPVEKFTGESSRLYQGTVINSGKCLAIVTATGLQTELGKMGKAISETTEPPTIMQKQISKFVRKLAFFGFAGFLIIWLANYLNTGDMIQSLLFGLTLAMAAIPEEIPVAFSSFMALGAYDLAKKGIITRKVQTLENLGKVNLICLDKTGTLTENTMQVKAVYNIKSDRLIEMDPDHSPGSYIRLETYRVLRYADLASENNPFDPMEKAIHEAWLKAGGNENHLREMIREYPLEGRPPMMTHVYSSEQGIIIAGKGGIERIIKVCRLHPIERERLNRHITALTSKGYRVIGVASASGPTVDMPASQNDFNWEFEGMLALYDPPKKNAKEVINRFIDAGLQVKLMTGDYPETAIQIAKETGFPGGSEFMTGEEVERTDPDTLRSRINETTIFSRMYPEAKLRVINAFKANGWIVAMTGDGVNDAPALIASHIGIAMGKKGTDVARESSSLILTDDNLEKIMAGIIQGRKIYSNLKKAIRYIISIHIPIILTAAIPLLFNWSYPNIFTPVHVIFLELIMGPTCSIFFEKEPMEKSGRYPSNKNDGSSFFTGEELLISIVQGLVITAGVLVLYYVYMNQGYSLESVRTVVFTTLIIANIALTFVNRSFTENITRTIFYRNPLAPLVFIASLAFITVINTIPLLRELFGLELLNAKDYLVSAAAGLFIVLWFEGYKTHLNEVLPQRQKLQP